jgi:hypothetical protein
MRAQSARDVPRQNSASDEPQPRSVTVMGVIPAVLRQNSGTLDLPGLGSEATPTPPAAGTNYAAPSALVELQYTLVPPETPVVGTQYGKLE